MYESKRVRQATVVWVLALAAALVLGLVGTRPALASEEEGTVVVGYYENEVFEEGASEGAVKTGYAYEYYRKLSEYTGWRYEYVYGDFADLYQLLLDGEVDLLAGLAKTKAREGIVGYPDRPMGDETLDLVAHADDEDVTSEPSSLAGKRIGVLDSALVAALEGYLAEHDIAADVVVFSGYEALFDAFDHGDVDVLAAEGDGAYGRSNAVVVGSFGTSEYYLCVSIDRPDLLEELNVAQSRIVSDEPDYLSGLHARYFPKTVAVHAFTAEEREWLGSHDSLTIGFIEDFLPYCDTDADGNVVGMVRDELHQAFTVLGLDVTCNYVGYTSYDEMIEAVDAGDIDAAFPVGGSLYYSEANGMNQTRSLVSTMIDLVFLGEYTDVDLASIAVNSTSRLGEYFVRTHFPEATIKEYDSVDACLEAVLSGEVGATMLDGLRVNDILRNGRYARLSHLQTGFTDDRCMGVRIGNEGLLKLLNRGASVVGDALALRAAYGYTDRLFKPTIADLIRENMALFALIVLFVGLLVIFFLLREARRQKEHGTELSNALFAAEAAGRAKSTFLNNMSHDIRTPMNAIVGFTTLAKKHAEDPVLVDDYLDKIDISSHHLLALINDILDMSVIESGHVSIEEDDLIVPELVHKMLTIVWPSVTEQKLSLVVNVSHVTHEKVIGDEQRISQVLINILSNAIKFTPEGGTITFDVAELRSLHADMARFEFTVTDTGIGMSEEFQKALFEPFTREQTSTLSGVSGTGLGMAITKNIIDIMKGDIDVTSAPGKGTTVRVVIDLRVVADDEDEARERSLAGMHVLLACADDATATSVTRAAASLDVTCERIPALVAAQAGPGVRALLVDEQTIMDEGTEALVALAGDGEAALPVVLLKGYDIRLNLPDEARHLACAQASLPPFAHDLAHALLHAVEGHAHEEDDGFSFEGRRVLLVEDNLLNQQIAVVMLEEVGLTVDVAVNGQEAVDAIEGADAGTYDAVLMDIQMPVMDGYEATRRIRASADAAKADIPIIAVTANVFEEDRAFAHDAGMDGYLAKPYEFDRMYEMLEGFFRHGRRYMGWH